jgi:hypothetical protein
VFGSSVNNRGLELISQLPELVELNISFSKADEDGIEQTLCNMKSLTTVAVDRLPISNALLQKLAQLPKLHDLSLSSCVDGSPGALGYLEKTKYGVFLSTKRSLMTLQSTVLHECRT